MVEDKPVEIDGWQPKNSGGKYAGPISLRTAFAYSKNTVAAQIGQEVGTSSIASMARRFGITTPINTQPSMVLGTSEARVIDMTQAFAAVAAKGRKVTPYGISKVTTIDGETLYAAKPSSSVQLVDDWVAGAMTDLMQSAVATGTGRAANIGRPVAGKTGTTSSNKDGWFLGFSSGLTTGVWMGRDDARSIGGLEGGRAPAQAWAAYMRIAVANRPVEKFATEVTFPERLEGEEPLLGEEELLQLDENGMPIEGDPTIEDPGLEPTAEPQPLDDAFIERAIGGRREPRPAPEGAENAR
jgi:penicillin-binding protein 1A